MAAERVRLNEKPKAKGKEHPVKASISKGGNYFAEEKESIDFISTGCTTLDMALGGGWARKRIFNIVGDKSTGKTLQVIEATANFAKKYPDGVIEYREEESAFDKPYAAALGMPLDRINFGRGEPMGTVEEFARDLEMVAKRQLAVPDKKRQPVFYALDSLDSLSDEAEQEREVGQATYGMAKAKNLSEFFRKNVGKLARADITLGVVSQVRSKVDVSYGRKTTRAGGRALDFYASQVLYLQHVGTLSKTIAGMKRATGIAIKAKVDKNKVGLPFREAIYDILFGFGVDDARSCVEWLAEAKGLDYVGLKASNYKEYLDKDLPKMSDADYRKEVAELQAAVRKRWVEVDTSFMPTRQKYA